MNIKDILEMMKGMTLEMAQRFLNGLSSLLQSAASLAEKALARSRQAHEVDTVKLSASGKPPFVSGLPGDMKATKEQKFFDDSEPETPQNRPR